MAVSASPSSSAAVQDAQLGFSSVISPERGGGEGREEAGLRGREGKLTHDIGEIPHRITPKIGKRNDDAQFLNESSTANSVAQLSSFSFSFLKNK